MPQPPELAQPLLRLGELARAARAVQHVSRLRNGRRRLRQRRAGARRGAVHGRTAVRRRDREGREAASVARLHFERVQPTGLEVHHAAGDGACVRVGRERRTGRVVCGTGVGLGGVPTSGCGHVAESPWYTTSARRSALL
eukprot:5565328-Prymnesium_polylepis.1